MMLTDEGRKFLRENKINNYTLNSDNAVDVHGNVDIITIQSKLPVKFGKVSGHFYCDYTQLTSLEGAPSYVGGYFSCRHNQLTSLEGAPSYIGHNFYCSYNKLTSLHNIHKFINELGGVFHCQDHINDSVLGFFLIKGIKGIIISNHKVRAIFNKHIEQGKSGVIGAQQDLLDAGLDEYARL